MDKRSLLYVVPYSVSSLDSGARVRAYNLSRHISKILDTIVIEGNDLKRAFLYCKFLLSKAKEIEAVYVEGLGSILTFLDYAFLNLMKDKKFFVYVRDVYWLCPGYFGKGDAGREIWNENNTREFDFYIKRADKLFFPTVSALGLARRHFGESLPQCGVLSAAGDADHFPPRPLPPEPHILFVGDLRLGAIALVEAIESLAADYRTMKLTLCGKCPADIAPQFEEKLKANKWLELKRVSYRQLPDLLSESYLCVIPRKKNFYNDLALPIKLFDYMAAGRPVVSTDCFETAQILEKYKAGIVCKDGVAEIAGAIETLIRNRGLAQTLGENGRRAVLGGNSWADRAQELAGELNSKARGEKIS